MSINIDKIDDGLPISIIVPLSNNRKNFFYNNVLPMLEANNPNEIIVNDDFGTAPKKRNDGFKKATQPYLFFCDDDIVLPANYLKILFDKLSKHENNASIGYVYTGYYGVVLHPESHPFRGNFRVESAEFNASSLKRGNYISTMSLIKKDIFPLFDENVKRFQDWDMYLTLLESNIEGIFIKDIFFWAFYLDIGITSNNNDINNALMVVRNKHNL